MVRWFGPAEALANIPGGIARIAGRPMRATTVSSLTGIHRLLDLRATNVDVKLLMLPPDFRETPWPGFEDPTRGRILVNSSDIRDFRLRTYRDLLAIVQQGEQ